MKLTWADALRTTAGTFIMPTGDRVPSLLRKPKLRAQLEWHRLKTRLMDYFRCVSTWGTAHVRPDSHASAAP